jgi:cobalt-zinc-cadmium efflux system protein
MDDHPHPPESHHHHDHAEHHHGAEEALLVPGRRLAWALGLTVSFMFAEIAAGIAAGSLALLSDAGHMATDAGALALALWAQALARRERTGRKTFGFRRAEILAALANGAVLGGTALWVVLEATKRLLHPTPVEGSAMLVVASLGLLVNIAAAWILWRGRGENLNVRAASAHVVSDAAGSIAAIVASVLILWRGWALADPIVSIVISVLIVVGAWRILRGAIDVLMEAVPAHIDVEELVRAIAITPGVAAVHDLHVWSISEGFPVVTVHVVLAPGYHGTEVARTVAGTIEGRVARAHVTVQPEAPIPPDHLLPAHTLVRR